MNRFLTAGQKIELGSHRLEIIECTGSGHSCTTYLAEERVKNVVIQHLVKEYNPRDLVLTRDKNLNLSIKEKDKERYQSGIERLIQATALQNELRQKNDLTNSICNVHDIFDAYNTCYIDMQVQGGKTYDDFCETNLQYLLKRIKTIVATVEKYHEAGYLLLDIKPDNLFVLNETTDIVLFFDFDSVIEKSELSQSDCISFTYEWSAPELICETLSKNVSEVSDYFSIGEILFYKLFGRHSRREERRAFSKYVYESSEFYSTDLNPKIWEKLTNVFRNTLCGNAKRRYRDASEFISALDEIIKLAEPNSYYFVSNIPEGNSCFIGREQEYKTIRELLLEKKSINVWGKGGIGKTELVKHYAYDHMADFEAAFFFTFEGSWKKLINHSVRNQIANFESDDENEEKLFDILMRVLNKLVTTKTLIIIDNVTQSNFGNCESDERNRIVGLPWKIIYTSRTKINTLYNFEVKELSKSSCEELVKSHFDRENVEISASHECDEATEIVEACDSNTLLLKIVSKLIRNCGLNAQKRDTILKQLSSTKNVEKCIGILCKKYITTEQRHILHVMSLMPIAGISLGLLCKHVDAEEVSQLINNGWLENDSFGVVSVHSVIFRVVQDDYEGRKVALSGLILSILKDIGDLNNSNIPLNYSREYQEIMLSLINHIDEVGDKAASEVVCLLGLYGWDEIIDKMDYATVCNLHKVFEAATPTLDENCTIDSNYKVGFWANYIYLSQRYCDDSDTRRLFDKAWNIAKNITVTLDRKLTLIYSYTHNLIPDDASVIMEVQNAYTLVLELVIRVKPTMRVKDLIAKILLDMGNLLRMMHVINGPDEFLKVGLSFALEKSLVKAKLLYTYSLVKEAQGDYYGAIDLCEKSISIKEIIYGYQARQLCDNLRLLSRLYRKVEEGSKSIKLSKQALEIASDAYGDSIAIVSSVYSLAEAYESDTFSYRDEIKQLLWRARIILEDTMGPRFGSLAENYYRFGHYYFLISKDVQAEAYLRRSIEMYEEDIQKRHGIPKPYHVNYFLDKAYYYLGCILKLREKYEDAIYCYSKAAELLELSQRDDLSPKKCNDEILKIRARIR